MKLTAAFSLVMLMLVVAAQPSGQNRFTVPKGATLPTYCGIGDLFTKTATTAGLYVCTAANTWTIITTGTGTGAPSDATYVTQTANSGLSAEQALASLSSGIMRVATTTGAVTSLTNSAGVSANISDETGTGVLVFATSPTLVTPTIGAASATSITIPALACPAGQASAVTITVNDTGLLAFTKTGCS